MICRSVLRLIAIPTIVVFVLFLVIQPEAIGRGGGGGERGGGGGERRGGGGYSREGSASEGRVSSGKGPSQGDRTPTHPSRSGNKQNRHNKPHKNPDNHPHKP